MARTIVSIALACLVVLPSGAIRAELPPKLTRELVDKVIGKFGREITAAGTEDVVKRLPQLSKRCGADAMRVFDCTGPKGLRVLEDAGQNAIRLAPILARQGHEAAWLIAHPERTALVIQHGGDAAKALVRHRHVGELMVREWGQPAAQALAGLHPQNGRRLAMLFGAGQPFAKPDANGLLGVIAAHGNPAMDFVWRNKGALAIAACLAAFVNDPKPFLEGGRDLAQVLGHAAVRPVAEAAREASRQMNWPVLLIAFLGTMAVWLYSGRRGKHDAPTPDGS